MDLLLGHAPQRQRAVFFWKSPSAWFQDKNLGRGYSISSRRHSFLTRALPFIFSYLIFICSTAASMNARWGGLAAR